MFGPSISRDLRSAFFFRIQRCATDVSLFCRMPQSALTSFEKSALWNLEVIGRERFSYGKSFCLRLQGFIALRRPRSLAHKGPERGTFSKKRGAHESSGARIFFYSRIRGTHRKIDPIASGDGICRIVGLKSCDKNAPRTRNLRIISVLLEGHSEICPQKLLKRVSLLRLR